MQLAWLVYTFGASTTMAAEPERIVKNVTKGGFLPTGCFHIHIHESSLDVMTQLMHRRILIDDTGAWVARSDREMAALSKYSNELKRHPEKRFQNRPYGTVT